MMQIQCQACNKFSYTHFSEREQAKLPGRLIEGVHGWCKGGIGIPAHYEHGESIRCVYFIEKEERQC